MMKLLRFAAPVALALTLAACATSRPGSSYVAQEISAADAQVMAGDTVAFLADPFPPARTTLVLHPPKANPGHPDTLTPVLIERLRERGYGITTVGTKEEGQDAQAGAGEALRYLATPMATATASGVVLRLQYLNQEATRFYLRNADGTLSYGSPFSVREGGAGNGK